MAHVLRFGRNRFIAGLSTSPRFTRRGRVDRHGYEPASMGRLACMDVLRFHAIGAHSPCTALGVGLENCRTSKPMDDVGWLWHRFGHFDMARSSTGKRACAGSKASACRAWDVGSAMAVTRAGHSIPAFENTPKNYRYANRTIVLVGQAMSAAGELSRN